MIGKQPALGDRYLGSVGKTLAFCMPASDFVCKFHFLAAEHRTGRHSLRRTVWTMCNDTGNNKWKHDRKCMIQRFPRPVSMSSPTTVSSSLWVGVTWQRRGWRWRLVYHPSSAEPVGAICTDGGGLSQRGPVLWSNGWGQTVTANGEEQKLHSLFPGSALTWRNERNLFFFQACNLM